MVDSVRKHLTFDNLVGVVVIAVAIWVGKSTQSITVELARTQDRLERLSDDVAGLAKTRSPWLTDRDDIRDRLLLLEVTTGIRQVSIKKVGQTPPAGG